MADPNPDIGKAELFRELGYGGDFAHADEAITAAGLTNTRKPRIALSKREKVAAVLRGTFFLVCNRGDCSKAAAGMADGREVAAAASQPFCEVCGGKANRAAVDEMVAAFGRAGWTRLVVVGGSPAAREEIKSLIAGRLELRLIDGTMSRTTRQAGDDLAWADRVAIWASTQLDHKVSNLYKGATVITVAHRGVQKLCGGLAESAGRAG